MKKLAAIFTIVKNENYFLKKWIRHYSKYIDCQDLYAIDHYSKDNSTMNLDINILKPLISGGELAYDHDWMKDCVEATYRYLLHQYECVMFTDVDEIIFTVDEPLNIVLKKFLEDAETIVQSIQTWDLVQVSGEKNLTFEDEIISNRQYMVRHTDANYKYDKTLLTKKQPVFDRGHHNMMNYGRDFKYGLQMLHLKKYDFNAMIERNKYRNQYERLFPDGNGMQNKMTDYAFMKRFFESENNSPEHYVTIPDQWREILKGL